MRALLFSSAFFLIAMNAAQASIHADGMWLRETIPGQPNGAGFGVLMNHGDDDRMLVGASSDVAADVEIHQHVHDGDELRMEQMAALTIPAHSSVELQPGGYHLMFMELNEPFQTGDEHEVTLIFADGETEILNIEVRDLVESEADHSHH